MKVGIVWENGFAKWVSQMFEPLNDIGGVDVTAFVGQRNKFDTSRVLLKTRPLTHAGEMFLGLSSFPSSLRRALGAPYRKMDFYRYSLRKYLEGFDVVECPDSSRSLYTLSGLKKEKGFKLVVSYAENIPYRQVFDEKTNCIKKAAFEMIDQFIPWCDTIKRTLLLEGVPEEKITTVYAGVDLNLFKPEPAKEGLRAGFGLKDSDFVALYAGKLVSWKGVHTLPYAAKILKERGFGNIRFLMAGRGAQLENLKRLISEAGVEDMFRFAGFMPYESVRDLYNLSDVLVLPSYPTMIWQEQFGMVLIEAMACGKPVVASTSGSIPEVVGDAGLGFIPGDFFGLSEKLALLMEDRRLLKELGEKARTRAIERFDAGKNALKIYEVYKKALAGR